MARRTWMLALAVGALLVASQSAVTSADGPPALPSSMAAVGDSISQAVSSGGSLGATYPENSWSTGTNTSVDSHYQRLIALNPAIRGRAYNRSVSGADMADLNGQMAGVVSLAPDYLTVLIGGNDLCTDTVDQMTPVATFQAEFETAMNTLTTGSPNTRVYVASIPNVYQLWQLFHNNWWARFIWSVGGICQSLLANPTSTNATDVARRAAVAERNVEYNTALAAVCAEHAATCRFDGNAVYKVTFSSSDVAGDYFHPSVSGQAKLAAVTWAAGYWPNGGPVTDNPPTAAFASTCTDLSCSFDASASTDDHTGMTFAWTFGDGVTATGVAPSHDYAAASTYTVRLTVTDSVGQTDSVSHDVTVTTAPPPPPDQEMHIASLTATSAPRKGGWTATVRVSIQDAGSQGVPSATVSGTWLSGGSAGCTTDSSGACSFTSNMNKKTKTATYTVTDVTANGYVWDGIGDSVPIGAP